MNLLSKNHKTAHKYLNLLIKLVPTIEMTWNEEQDKEEEVQEEEELKTFQREFREDVLSEIIALEIWIFD